MVFLINLVGEPQNVPLIGTATVFGIPVGIIGGITATVIAGKLQSRYEGERSKNSYDPEMAKKLDLIIKDEIQKHE